MWVRVSRGWEKKTQLVRLLRHRLLASQVHHSRMDDSMFATTVAAAHLAGGGSPGCVQLLSGGGSLGGPPSRGLRLELPVGHLHAGGGPALR